MTQTMSIWRRVLDRRRHPFYVRIGLTALLVWVFASLADEVLDGETIAFDTAVTGFFREPGDTHDPWGPVWFEEAMRDVTGLGSITVLGFVLLATVLYLSLSGARRTALFVAFAVSGGALLSTGLKLLFDRPRPEVEAAARVFSASFPSGHATVSAVVYLTLGLLLAEASRSRRIKAYFLALGLIMTIVVGISRVYLGVHFPTDVLAGWAIGSAWALACWAGYALLLGRRSETNPT
jgi:undecaprenyl-diphosphatase